MAAMAKTGFEQDSSQPLPAELIAVVDGLTAGSVEGVIDARIANFRLTYGVEGREAVVSYLQQQLSTASAAYRTELTGFVRTGQPDVGVPPSAVNNPRYSKSLPHEGLGMELDSWLVAARRHDPETANGVATEVADVVINGFDRAAYAAAVDALSEQYGRSAPAIASTLSGNAERLSWDTTSRISSFTTDSDVARRFMQSGFFATFGNDVMRLELHNHIVQLEGHTTTAGHSESYNEILRILGSSPITIDVASGLFTVAERSPALIGSLAKQHPARAYRLQLWAAEHILSLDESVLTAEHHAAMTRIEKVLSRNADAYTQLLDAYRKRDGDIAPAKLTHLAELIGNSSVRHPYATVLIAAYIPAEDLARTLSERPYLTREEGAKSIAVRRLARAGAVDQARVLIDQETDTIDMPASVGNSIRNLLAIYEESGDERALEETKWRIEAPNPGWTGPNVNERYEFAARRYVAACKHSHEAAAAEMEAILTSANAYEVEQALKLTLQMFLDGGEIETAEQYAVRLFSDEEIRSQPYSFTSHAALLAVVGAYAQANRLQDAIRLVQTHLLSESLNHHALLAIETIATRGKSSRLPLRTRHLDPLRSASLE